ncbi:MAG: PH domain-containing protein [Pseudomonadales bacterium]|nr:PH domain-containing protein [Pseudomonadales bacterium]
MTMAPFSDEEPVNGLPAELPQGERLLWQGSPDSWRLALSAFRIREVAFYFLLVALWRGGSALYEGQGLADAAIAAAFIVLPATLAVATLWCIALGYGLGTVYTLTSERVVIRSGVLVTITMTIPFSLIDGAALRSGGDGSGDVVLTLDPDHDFSWLMLWPNTRPWHVLRPQPMLRAIPEANLVASLLARELRRSASEVAGPRVEQAASDTAGGMTPAFAGTN